MPLLTDMRQQSPEWVAAHLGMVTGRSAGALLSPGSTAHDSLKARVMYERLTGAFAKPESGKPESGKKVKRLQEGLNAEGPMIAAYKRKRICEIIHDEAYFLDDDLGDMFGFSPDGVIADAFEEADNGNLIEGKNLDGDNHLLITEFGRAIDGAYIAQAEYGCVVMRCQWCDICLYRDELGLDVQRIEVGADRRAQIRLIMRDFHAGVNQRIKDYRGRNGR